VDVAKAELPRFVVDEHCPPAERSTYEAGVAGKASDVPDALVSASAARRPKAIVDNRHAPSNWREDEVRRR